MFFRYSFAFQTMKSPRLLYFWACQVLMHSWYRSYCGFLPLIELCCFHTWSILRCVTSFSPQLSRLLLTQRRFLPEDPPITAHLPRLIAVVDLAAFSEGTDRKEHSICFPPQKWDDHTNQTYLVIRSRFHSLDSALFPLGRFVREDHNSHWAISQLLCASHYLIHFCCRHSKSYFLCLAFFGSSWACEFSYRNPQVFSIWGFWRGLGIELGCRPILLFWFRNLYILETPWPKTWPSDQKWHRSYRRRAAS